MTRYLASQSSDEASRLAWVFLRGKLENRETLAWALAQKPNQAIRQAVGQLLDERGSSMSPMWLDAWRLLEESWSSEELHHSREVELLRIQGAIDGGDRSRALVRRLAALARPSLQIRPGSAFGAKVFRPKRAVDLCEPNLVGGRLLSLSYFQVAKLSDTDFIADAIRALDQEIDDTFSLARRVGWLGTRGVWRIGLPKAVRYRKREEDGPNDFDVDEFGEGLVGLVKLAFALADRVSVLNLSIAQEIAGRWRARSDAAHLRMWAALACDRGVASIEEVWASLSSLAEEDFWGFNAPPEFAELRLSRYSEFSKDQQEVLLRRLRKGPPISFWSKSAGMPQRRDAQLYWAHREVKAIIDGGNAIPKWAAKWWAQADLSRRSINASRSVEVTPPPDIKEWTALSGVDRLRRLEASLKSEGGGADSRAAQGAIAWMASRDNLKQVLGDLEERGNGVAEFPLVWKRFSRTFRVLSDAGSDEVEKRTVATLLSVLEKSDSAILGESLHSATSWLMDASRMLNCAADIFPAWRVLWEGAKEEPIPEAKELSWLATAQEPGFVTERPADGESELHLSLNTPLGQLVVAFLQSCPTVATRSLSPFSSGSALLKMRDAIDALGGRTRLLALYQLIRSLDYFWEADRAWCKERLTNALKSDSSEDVVLWTAISRMLSPSVLRQIGGVAVIRAQDSRLDRTVRGRILYVLVVERLRAHLNSRSPAIEREKLSQCLRSVEGEVRTAAARAVVDFLSNVPNEPAARSALSVFEDVVIPFFAEDWPRDRQLVSASLSGLWSKLPALVPEAFSDVVEVIAPYLMPFDCWSLSDYGFFGEGADRGLALICSADSARGLLKLLDLTVGESESAIVPWALDAALDRIVGLAPDLEQTGAFRRLATAARRR